MTQPLARAVHDGPGPARRGAVAEFFHYHGAWAPGIRLFRRVGFQAKALIISAVFAVPIAALSWSYYGDKAAAIGFSAKERVGIDYAASLRPLQDLLQQQRQAVLRAEADGKAPAAPDAAALEAGLARLAAAEARLGEELGTAKAFGAFKAALAAPAPAGGEAAYAAHSARTQALLDLLGVATDGSNLTLDPDIDTYYLMDAAYFRLPPMAEATAQLRDRGAALLAAGSTTPAQVRSVIEQAAVLSGHAAGIQAGIAKANDYNGGVRAAVREAEALAEVQAFLKLVDSSVLKPEGAQGDPAALSAAGQRVLAALQGLSERSDAELDRLIAVRVDAMESGRRVTTAVLIGSLLLVCYLFIAFGRVLSGGLRALTHHVEAMRGGDLTTTPRAWGNDETARLIESVAGMQQSLRRIVGDVRQSADQIVQASGEIASGSSDLSTRTGHTAASLEESAAAMEQIAATMRQTADTTNEATRIAQASASAAERGNRVIGAMATTMDEIQGSARKIADIIGTIDGIAFQTNILALNAAVESARAGEAGRGFAVVASEVRQLAQRAAGAAREVRALITASVEQVSSGSRVAEEAAQAVGEIVGSARRVSELLADIATGAKEQDSGVRQTTQAVQAMDSATQQNAALVEQTAAAAASLRDQAGVLAAGVAVFKL
jgi:methyl-accepting chemotaxis protein